LFAPLVVAFLYGNGYTDAAALLRVLVLAAVVSLVNNVLSTVLLALGKGPRMLLQNSVGLAANVVLNIALVPSYGVAASAWATLITEGVVCAASVHALSGRVNLAMSGAVSVKPALAVTASAGAAVALYRWQLPALLLSCGGFLAVTTVLRGWPAELWARRHE
jgi:O-antigen/teichoic acid export membrane protein